MNIVIDIETTGLDPDIDEILQIALCNQDGQILLSTYCRPENIMSWPEAERINRISPQDVIDAPFFKQIIPQVLEIINQAEYVYAYNIDFEAGFLFKYGIEIDKWGADPMIEFAEIYGEWSDYFWDYKWQKLTTACRYFDIKIDNAHDAAADAKATAALIKKIEERNLLQTI